MWTRLTLQRFKIYRQRSSRLRLETGPRLQGAGALRTENLRLAGTGATSAEGSWPPHIPAQGGG
jgi:hypothetical protein